MSDALQYIGKYEIRREIGRGGSARVYEAYDPSVGRRIAIKVLLHTADDPEKLTRFRYEAASTGNLQHKNIVTIYDFGDFDGAPYIAMEYLEGEDLQQIITAARPLTLVDKVRIMTSVGQGLQHAHQSGVVHRDIKPANVKVLPDGSVKIMDFGIARLVREASARLTRTGAVLGTLIYMAPEQFTGVDTGHLGDIFAYGVTYYELLSGKHPFAAADPASTMFSIMNVEPAPLSSLELDCPPALEKIVARAMAKDPQSRYQSMKDLLFDAEPVFVELRTREAARLLTEASPLLETGDLAAAEATVGKALELDPSNQQARELWRRVEHLSQSSILFKARPTLETAGPAAPEQSAVVNEESFTRMFSTVPVRPEPHAKSSVPLPPIEAAPANVTSVFALPEPVGRAGQPFTKHDQPPTDTVLTISNCADPAFLGTKVGLQRFPFTIGRSDAADWKLLFDDAVSARHAEIAFREDGFFVRDLGSSNGTFLNGQRLHPMRDEVLLFGARVTLGSNTELVFGAGALQEIPDVKGKLIGNRFTLREKIYSSSKSVLYLARDENLNRDVAVKLLSPSLIRYAGYREQFSREAQTASLLRHPNICQVIDYGEVCLEERTGSRSLYVCREYLTGGSLRSRLNQGEALPLDRIASWLDTLCSALDYVHGRGMIHAGIKPSAIVFDAEGVPYLTDFSLATKSGDGARHAVIGAPAFLAPEQWEGADPVPATDQYSLAVLFYGLIAGALPFEGQEHYVVRKRNLQRGPVPVHEMAAQSRRPPVPLAVSAVLQKALAVQASDRFPGARDFATAFRSALVEPVTPRISPPSVFISYHRATSSAWALLLKREMERDHGFQVFVDAEQQDSTGQFPVKLQRRINQCDVFVCLLAESTLASDWVKREIEFASQIGKPMIPVFQESYRDPPNLGAVEPHIQELLTFEGVKLLDRQNIYFDATMQALIASVRRSMETAEHRSRPLAVTPFASAQSPGEGVARRLMRKVRAFLYSA